MQSYTHIHIHTHKYTYVHVHVHTHLYYIKFTCDTYIFTHLVRYLLLINNNFGIFMFIETSVFCSVLTVFIS